MSDGDVKKEGAPIKRQTKIRTFAIIRAGLGHRGQAGLSKEGDEELEKDSVSSRD
jgi:hypothetical protein